MKGSPNIFRKSRPAGRNDSSSRIKKIRSKRRENTISPNQKKLRTSTDPLEFGPSNKTGGLLSGTGYPVAIIITILFLLITGLIMKFT